MKDIIEAIAKFPKPYNGHFEPNAQTEMTFMGYTDIFDVMLLSDSFVYFDPIVRRLMQRKNLKDYTFEELQ